jgi:hypothetical protein
MRAKAEAVHRWHTLWAIFVMQLPFSPMWAEIFYGGAQMCNFWVCRSAETVSCLKLPGPGSRWLKDRLSWLSSSSLGFRSAIRRRPRQRCQHKPGSSNAKTFGDQGSSQGPTLALVAWNSPSRRPACVYVALLSFRLREYANHSITRLTGRRVTPPLLAAAGSVTCKDEPWLQQLRRPHALHPSSEALKIAHRKP